MKTRNIDEAAYLLYKGHRPRYTKYANNDAEFSFTGSDALKKDAARFLKGEVMVNVTKYLYCRTYLKQSISKEDAVVGEFAHLIGRRYYYIDENKVVQASTFGNKPFHKERYEQGNYYAFKNDAVAEANKQKHPLHKADA